MTEIGRDAVQILRGFPERIGPGWDAEVGFTNSESLIQLSEGEKRGPRLMVDNMI